MAKTPLKNALIAGIAFYSLTAGAIGFAQVGPPSPVAPKVPEAGPPGGKLDQVKSSFMKFFNKKDETTAAAAPTDHRPKLEKSVGGPITNGVIKGQTTVEEPKEVKPPARPPLLTPVSQPDVVIAEPQVSPENPPKKLVTLDNPANPLGLTDAQNRLNLVTTQIDKKDWAQAKVTLPPLRQWLVDSTEAHINLYKTLNNIPTARAQAELEKQLALQFAMLRDKALFYSGQVEVSQKNYKGAIKELVEVIKSQPRGELGLKAYQILQEIGFTEKLQLAE